MTDAIEHTYDQILDKQGAFANLENMYFDTLLTFTNQDLVSWIKNELTKWDSGSAMSFEGIKADALMKYNNICKILKKDKKTFNGHNIASGPNSSRNPVIAKDTKAKLVALTI